jgi:uncharacterized protein (TIGR02246 family)
MDVDRSIQELIDNLADAWNRLDWPAFGRLFAEDADYVTGAGIRLAGRAQIVDVLSRQAALSVPGQDVSLAAESVKLLPSEIAVVLCSWRMGAKEGTDAIGGARAGLLTMVMRSNEAGWRIIALHNTDRTDR